MPVSKDEITVVIPTLDEEDGIGQVIMELKRIGYHNILVVDGYSTDGTAKVAESLGGIVISQHSMGKSGAVETAIENVKTPYLLVIDGDCTYDPKDIDSFLIHADKYDQIIGVRINGKMNIPRLNRFGNKLITTTFNALMGTKLSDVCSGMYMIKTDVARQFELNSRGFDVEVEIAAQTATRGRVTEVPISYRKRVGHQKLSSWKHGLQIIRSIFRLARTYNPTLLFSGLVALAAIPAFLILGWVALQWISYGVWNSGYTLLSFLLLILASQSLVVSIISIMLRRMEKRLMRQTSKN